MPINSKGEFYTSERVYIEPVNPMINNQILQGSYQVGNKMRILTTPNTYIEEDINLPKGKSQTPSFDIVFHNDKLNKRMMLNFDYEISSDPKAPIELRDNKRIVDEFWSKHIGIVINADISTDKDGRPIKPIDENNGWVKTTRLALFNLVYPKIKKEKAQDHSLRRFKAVSILMAMDLKQLRDVAYFFNQVPGERDETDLRFMLVGEDYKSGIIFKNEKIGSLSYFEEFERTFMNDKNPQYNIVLNIRKAILTDVIQQRKTNTGTSYFYGDERIGISEFEVQQYFTNNETLYKGLKDKIKGVNNDHADDTKSIANEIDANGLNTYSDIRAVAKDLFERGKIEEERYRKMPGNIKTGSDTFKEWKGIVEGWLQEVHQKEIEKEIA